MTEYKYVHTSADLSFWVCLRKDLEVKWWTPCSVKSRLMQRRGMMMGELCWLSSNWSTVWTLTTSCCLKPLNTQATTSLEATTTGSGVRDVGNAWISCTCNRICNLSFLGQVTSCCHSPWRVEDPDDYIIGCHTKKMLGTPGLHIDCTAFKIL